MKTVSLEAVWHDIECGAYRADLSLWRELVTASKRRTGSTCDLLEIGCGTGRVSLALAGPDCHVTAVDLDPDLVDVLVKRARARGVTVAAAAADVRSLDLGSSFDLILAPMQVAQLLDEADRSRMLAAIVRHLRPDGRVALSLLDLDEEWDASSGPLPPADGLKRAGWTYSSQPVAVKRAEENSTLCLDTVRRVTSPDGEQSETFSRIRLDLVSPARLEEEASRADLVPDERRNVPATRDHVASAVVILRKANA